VSEFKRNINELRTKAVLHWPSDLLQKVGDSSVLPLLLQTQDLFLSLLKSSTANPMAWYEVLPHSKLTGTVFLKHLMVLTDLGGEALNKLTPLSLYFPESTMVFVFNGYEHAYKFKAIGSKTSLTNVALHVDAKGLITDNPLDYRSIDVAMLLLYGSQSINDSLPEEVKEKCVVGSLTSNPQALDRFVRENYLRVSRQTGGARANALGQAVQDYVIDQLHGVLPHGWRLERNGTLSGVKRMSGGEETTFDVVARSPNGVCFGIEVSFQVTTNSTIERKAREAEFLKDAVKQAGHLICYVIDGAGNINVRTAATSILCSNSDCTVAMSAQEIAHLGKFLVHEAKQCS
jgi:hypothetical protein